MVAYRKWRSSLNLWNINHKCLIKKGALRQIRHDAKRGWAVRGSNL